MKINLQIQYKKFKKMMKGFSLAELLIVIGTFLAVGTVILTIMIVTLRVSKKSELLIVLKQNGNGAISQISKSVRYAKSLDDPTSCNPPTNSSSITIRSILDNKETQFVCTGGASPTIASNGASLVDSNSIKVTSCYFSCTQATENDPPVVSVNFTLSSKTSSNLVENVGSVPFKTSIIMRNVTR